MKDPIEIFEDDNHEWRYRLRARNGEILFTSEGYVDRYGANRGRADMIRNMLDLAMATTASELAPPLSMSPPPGVQYVFRSRIVRWVDGDTVDLRVALPFHLALGNDDKPARFRLYGIQAPERGTVGGAESKAYVNAMCPAESIVTVRSYLLPEPSPDDPDSFGRWLAEVWTGDGRNLNRLMLDEGYAVPYVKK